MKNLIFIILMAIFAYSNENLSEEFDSEYSEKKTELIDPFSGYNRLMTTFNDKVYLNVLNPTAKGYAYVVPETVRIGIDNFFNNLMYPIRLTNNLLQLKFKNSASETGRFLVNTIWGLGGLMDPAKHMSLTPKKEDFGQTLGFYGVGEGFHVVLPLLGPSNLRDIAGMGADSYISVLSTTGSSDIGYKIPNTTTEQLAIRGTDVINETSLKQGQYETLKKDALDLYPFLRDIYSQARQKQIEE